MKDNDSIKLNWYAVLAVAVLCILSRLPQLMSPYLHADNNGDECVLGLMANHMALGKEFPFYFWGQSYGFAWIEAGAVALAIKIFGISIYSIKVPILLLWTAGCVFFYGALARWTSKIYGFWITCLLIFSPAWDAWSMRARCGYITAFLLSAIVLFLIAGKRQSLTKNTWLFVGILSGFIYYSQPVFLLGLLPLLLYVLLQEKEFKSPLFYVAGITGVIILGKVMVHIQSNTDFWKPQWFNSDKFSVLAGTFKQRLFDVLNQDSGSYWASVIVSKIWCVIFLIIFGIYATRSLYKKINPLSTALLISVVLILASLFFVITEARYFLSLSVFLILWFGIECFEWTHKSSFLKIILGLVMAAVIILGIITAWDFKDFYRSNPVSPHEIPESQRISQMIKFLNASGVQYIFSVDDDLSWELMFFSGEKIISRELGLHCRQPAYNGPVTKAFLGGQNVAVVGSILDETAAYLIIAQEGWPQFFADKYFVYLNPSKRLIIEKLRFRLF